MYKNAVAFVGTGDVSYKMAADLLEDFLPSDDVLLILPSYMTSEGLKTVKEWAEQSGHSIERRRRDDMIQALATIVDAKEKFLIVLGTEGSEKFIADAMEEGILCADLCKGLFYVPGTSLEVPSYGSESDPKDVSASSPTPGRVADFNTAESLTATAMILKRVEQLEKEMKELRAHVGISEQFGTPEVTEPVETENKTKYYQDANGKLRKAGRSRARNGEEEMWLTDDEYAEIK